MQAQALLELGKRRDGDRQDTHEPHEQALREGILLPGSVYDRLKTCAEELGVAFGLGA